MSLLTIILYSFECLALMAVLGIVLTKNVFHAALLLMVCLLAIAGIFVIYAAEFMAVTQILIYAGGVLVLIVFGVMLTSRPAGKPLVVKNQYIFSASLASALLAIVLIKLFSAQKFHQQEGLVAAELKNPIQQLGISLMSDYAVAFEVAGVLLLVALIGAAVTASSFRDVKKQ